MTVRSVKIAVGFCLPFIFAALAVSCPANAQDIKTITWQEFWRGVELKEIDGEMKFSHAGRELLDRTMVEIPAGTLRVITFKQITLEKSYSENVVVLDSIGPESDTSKFLGRRIDLIALFICDQLDEVACRHTLSTLLGRDIVIQSTGAAIDPRMPNRILFTFLVNPIGRFLD